MLDFLTSDLSRNFGVGFAVGAVGVALANGADWLGAVPQIIAALLG